MKRLEGRIALITGGNSGIGLATAKEFVAEGASVTITGRDRATLDEAARALGTDAQALQADAGRLDDIDRVVDAIKRRFGRLDVMFLNAGIAKLGPLVSTMEETFDETIRVNVKGPYFTVQKALPLFDRGGSIILNGSITGQMGMPNWSVYSASKAAVRSLARTLAAELVARDIRVNVISPGPVRTPIFGRTGLPPQAVEERAELLRQQVPMKRFGRPEEIEKIAVFLASDESSFMAGSELVADGGVSQL